MNQVSKVCCEKPLSEPSKKELWNETIEVWDYLVETGHSPADFSLGIITMRRQGFKKLVKENTNSALTKETRHYKVSALYLGNVEISFTEVKSDDQNKWLLEENWKPLQ
jgi:hypothetical protein